MKKLTDNQKAVIISIIALLAVASALLYIKPHETGFCFTFAHDTQFGDRKVENPSNQGIVGKNGVEYYPIEVQALQKALKNDGLYIDSYEETGGKVYLTSFFGPTTQAALKDFQKKHGLPSTGEVDNDTIDALNTIYACPKTESPAPSATSTTPTTSPKNSSL
jgi:murein L,D-transpeptidase YcbB/YkuD